MEEQYEYQNPFERRPILKSSKAPAPPAAVRWIKDWVPQDIVATGAKCYLRKWVTEETKKRLEEKEKDTSTTGVVSDPDPDENYHICPYSGCGKRYAHEYKLKKHVAAYHEKNGAGETPNMRTPPPAWKVTKTPRTPAATVYGSASASSLERPYACPYQGCDKAYIHEYKLKLHFREHPGHLPEENNNKHDLEEGCDQDFYRKHAASNGKSSQTHRQQSRAKPNMRTPAAKAVKKGSTSSPGSKKDGKKTMASSKRNV